VKVGDLILFKPKGAPDDDWSNAAIVVREWEHLDKNKQPIWIAWCEGYECTVDSTNYDVTYLTTL
jgi:hypothetical protein